MKVRKMVPLGATFRRLLKKKKKGGRKKMGSLPPEMLKRMKKKTKCFFLWGLEGWKTLGMMALMFTRGLCYFSSSGQENKFFFAPPLFLRLKGDQSRHPLLRSQKKNPFDLSSTNAAVFFFCPPPKDFFLPSLLMGNEQHEPEFH